MTAKRYNPFDIEPKWQKHWEETKTFKSLEKFDQPKYYVLEMFPYPSGNLHMGHLCNYTIGDVVARIKKAQGFNVLHPMGFDSFGLPAENAAIKNGVQPKAWTLKNIEQMRQELRQVGLSYDWDREVVTCLPDYYKFNQQLFIDMFNKGLAYQKESLVNWDPVDNTVLANEQVVDGKGWRSGAKVERRNVKQWFFKITAYADELLDNLKNMQGWPERVRIMQENWIGRSQGLEFTFKVEGYEPGLTVYTTRPDTLMGVTFCSIAPEHPMAVELVARDQKAADFIQECQNLGTSEEAIETAEKKGYKTPYLAIHPITGEEIPIFIANFVLMGYGTGAVMAVPAHDERDFDFAKKYKLPIKKVIQGTEEKENTPYTGKGALTNSSEFDGLPSEEAKKVISKKIEKMGGESKTLYRLRDWGLSRQRYWGCPIPMVYCGQCGVVAENKEKLPVLLPDDVSFSGAGNPLANHPTWKHCVCPKCGGKAERETDTMDTFVDSSWYFARYVSPKSSEIVDKKAADYWLGVDQYIGGVEHAVMHLLYARFFTKVMRDMGYIKVDEPAVNLLTQGMVISPSYQDAKEAYVNPAMVVLDDKGQARHKDTGEALQANRSEKMSKSKNNGVDMHALFKAYGVDSLRTFLMFVAPVESDKEWSDAGVEGAWRFLGRVWNLVHNPNFPAAEKQGKPVAMIDLKDKEDKELKRSIHKTIKKVSFDAERFQFNTIVAALMELSNKLAKTTKPASEVTAALYWEGVETLVRLLNPLAPHITEELWCDLGHKETLWGYAWPKPEADALVDEEITLVVQVNGKLRGRLAVAADIQETDAKEQALALVAEHLQGLTIEKCIVVPGRLVNVVAR